MSNPAEVQEEEMFGRITNRIDALIKGNANFEQLKEHIQTALEMDTDGTLLDGVPTSETMVARVAAAHQLAKRYEPALEVIARQEGILRTTAETIVTLGEDVEAQQVMAQLERKRADDLQAEKDLIAEKLSLIEPEPEPVADAVPDPDEPDIAPDAADGADHDSEAAE